MDKDISCDYRSQCNPALFIFSCCVVSQQNVILVLHISKVSSWFLSLILTMKSNDVPTERPYSAIQVEMSLL